MKIVPDKYVCDFAHRKTYAKKPRLRPQDSKSSRIWRKRNGKRQYGWKICYYCPRAYALRHEGELVVVCSYQTYAKIESGEFKTDGIQEMLASISKKS